MKAQATTTTNPIVSAARVPSATINSANHPAERVRERHEGIVAGPVSTA
jgi:hypothetical protein